MADTAEVTVRLERAHRDALRREIWILSSGVNDLTLSLDPDADPCQRERYGREWFMEWFGRLERIRDVLDAIGWEDEFTGPIDVPVSAEFADWARSHQDELEQSMRESFVEDEDLDALSAFTLIGGAR